MLCGIAYNLIGDLDSAKDVVQDVFVKLWKRKDELTFDDAIANYLRRATTHASFNFLNQQRNRMRILSEIRQPSFREPGEDTQSISFKELEKMTRDAIDRLPPKCKVIFLLSRTEEMKYREIAEHLGISIKTVENQMGIALEKIREDLRPYLTKEFLLPVLILVLLGLLLKIIL